MIGQPLELVAESSREEGEGESPVPPDHISTSASEDSAASNSSQAPKILDFIGGATCEVTSWFTSCFPCAVVDIDEQDGRVVNRLSTESAMNAMYSSPVKVQAHEPLPLQEVDAKGAADNNAHLQYEKSPQRGAVESNAVYTHLSIMTVADSELIRSQGNEHKLRVIEDDDATEVETISLDSERQTASPVPCRGRKKHTSMSKKMKKLFKGSKKKKNVAPVE